MRKITIFFFLTCFLTSCGFYKDRFKGNVEINDSAEVYVCLPTQAPIDTLLVRIKNTGTLKDMASFEKTARKGDLAKKYKPGRYQLKNGMTNHELVQLFKSGKQTPVKVTFHYARTVNHLAGKLNRKLEADSIGLVKFWNDHTKMKELYGIEPPQIPMLFLPNTYEFYWNTDAREFTDKMFKEYEKFWNDERKAKAEKLGLTPAQVVTLASIVQSEQTKYKEEWPIIAKLYLNRLKTGMFLQADPTVIYAIGDFTITRVLERHLAFESPYNTYLHTGLPPGPIMITEGECIDAVLNPDDNDFIYMCAKEDFSGRHNFTASYAEHNRNAAKYRTALSRWEREH